jgi:hypothetical protein
MGRRNEHGVEDDGWMSDGWVGVEVGGGVGREGEPQTRRREVMQGREWSSEQDEEGLLPCWQLLICTSWI